MKLKAFIAILGALAVLSAQMWPLSTKDFGSAAAAAESNLTLEQILDRVENHYTDKSLRFNSFTANPPGDIIGVFIQLGIC